LIGKFVNIASRTAGFLQKHFDGRIFERQAVVSAGVGEDLAGLAADLAELYEARDFGKVVRRVMEAADFVNGYYDTSKPWELAKRAPQDEAARVQLHVVCTVVVESFRILATYLAPILPRLASEAFAFLNLPAQQWRDIHEPLKAGHKVSPYKHLMSRVEEKQLDELFGLLPDASAPAKAERPAKPQPAAKGAASSNAAAKTAASGPQADGFISIDDFAKVDLRIAKIVNAELVEGSDKLLRLTLDVGETNESGQPRTRNVFSGIKSAYAPESLIGQHTVLVANLAPRKMKFGVSEGMVLAASAKDDHNDAGLYLLNPHAGASAGMKVT